LPFRVVSKYLQCTI